MIRDLSAILGFLAVVTGCHLAWPPAAWIVGGLMLLVGAVYGYRNTQKGRGHGNP